MNSLNLNIQTRHKSVVCFQIYSSKDLEDSLNKIREVLSDDKQDWEHRVTAVSHCLVSPLLLSTIQALQLEELVFSVALKELLYHVFS